MYDAILFYVHIHSSYTRKKTPDQAEGNMDYYCNVCKKPITQDVFRYSMNKYKTPLCSLHQEEHQSVHSQEKMSSHTKSLQSMMKRRQQTNEITEPQENEVRPQSIKDWINADINTWDEALKKTKTKK
jgi:hypothetical protein